MDELRFEVNEGVALVTLDRPHRKNAFTLELIDAWAAALRSCAADPLVGAVVVTGAGDAFCSGIDLEVLDGHDPSPLARKQLIERIHQVALALQDLDKPVIAAVNGIAVGAGLDMALMCDLRLAGASARMGATYVRLGLVPGDGGCYYLPRLVGRAKALELLLTGDLVSAPEALALGMVNHVYEDDRVLDEALTLAARFAAGPRVAQALIKRSVYQCEEMTARSSLELISSHMAIAMNTRDSQEAAAARREGRPPVFRGC